MSNTKTQSEPITEKVDRSYEFNKQTILMNPYTPRNLIRIIELLEDVDVVRALHVLDAATHLFKIKFEEIKKENA
jgi:hypothetical protein